MENISKSSEMDYMPFPIPGATSGKLFAKILNVDTKYGPVFAELKLEAGAFYSSTYSPQDRRTALCFRRRLHQ